MAETDSPEAPDLSTPVHGGDLAFAAARYGDPKDGWLDLSTGINPNGYTPPVIPRHLFARLPDSRDLDTLLAAARKAYGLPNGVDLIAVPGSEIAVRLLPYATPPGTVAIVGPTYGSHRAAWVAADRDVAPTPTLDTVPPDAAVVIVGNPNNPDGRAFEPEQLAALARNLGDRNGLLIVDEAFADVRPELSLMPHLDGLAAVVLRSLGKFYGLAGVRLGFVAGQKLALERLGDLVGAWPVSGSAIAIGQAALTDDAWRSQKRRRLKHDAERLRKLLGTQGLTITGGTDLFVLVEDTHARALHVALAQRGIWTRVFADEWRWLRIGLPTEAGFARLDRALSEIR